LPIRKLESEMLAGSGRQPDDTLSHDWCVDIRPTADYTTAVHVSGLLTSVAQAITRSSVVRIVVRNTALRSQQCEVVRTAVTYNGC
jgi:hypothetical protein